MKEWKLSIFNIVDKRIKRNSAMTNRIDKKKYGLHNFHTIPTYQI